MTVVPDDAVTGSRGIGARLGALYSGYWRLAGDLAGIALGSSPARPAAGDWRFKDPAWTDHPFYRRLGQAYTASCAVADETLDDMARSGRASPAARFLLTVLETASAPTNTLLGNPAAVKRAYETGGLSLVRGMRNFAGDVRHNGGMPSTVDRSGYVVGRDFAITPGAVVDRDPYAEVIQYTPSTAAGAGPPGADRPAADRALLLPGPAPGPEHGRVRGRPGAADVHGELAEPHARAGRLGPGHVRRAGADRHRGGPRGHRGAGHRRDRVLRGRHLDHDGAQPSRRPWSYAGPLGELRGDAAGLGAGGAGQGVLRGPAAGPGPVELRADRGDQRPRHGRRVHLDAAR